MKIQSTLTSFLVDNIDTDQIIPARFLKTISKDGLGDQLFYDWRYNADGSQKPEFVLNTEKAKKSQVLVSGDNFGCGSSREHAPWALLDQGIRCVISTSFADIFHNNCFQNGILPIKLPQADVDKLMDDAKRGQNARFTVDLEKQEITRPDGDVIKFEIDAFKKHCLLNGLDNIGLTLEKKANIDDFETRQRASQPWRYAKAGRTA